MINRSLENFDKQEERATLQLWLKRHGKTSERLERSFADGTGAADILQTFLPRYVNRANYPPCSGQEKKISNWRRLNERVLSRVGMKLSWQTICELAHGRPGRIEPVLRGIMLLEHKHTGIKMPELNETTMGAMEAKFKQRAPKKRKLKKRKVLRRQNSISPQKAQKEDKEMKVESRGMKRLQAGDTKQINKNYGNMKSNMQNILKRKNSITQYDTGKKENKILKAAEKWPENEKDLIKKAAKPLSKYNKDDVSNLLTKHKPTGKEVIEKSTKVIVKKRTKAGVARKKLNGKKYGKQVKKYARNVGNMLGDGNLTVATALKNKPSNVQQLLQAVRENKILKKKKKRKFAKTTNKRSKKAAQNGRAEAGQVTAIKSESTVESVAVQPVDSIIAEMKARVSCMKLPLHKRLGWQHVKVVLDGTSSQQPLIDETKSLHAQDAVTTKQPKTYEATSAEQQSQLAKDSHSSMHKTFSEIYLKMDPLEPVTRAEVSPDEAKWNEILIVYDFYNRNESVEGEFYIINRRK